MAFIISGSFRGGTPNEKRLVGTVERTGASAFEVTDAKGERHAFQVSDPVRIFLNEKLIAFDQIENGRTASVRYVRKKRVLFATTIEVFPTHRDFLG